MLTRPTDWWKSVSGVAAVEFAMIAPVLVIMLLGTIGLCNALAAHRKVIGLASNISSLIAMPKSVTSTDISNAYGAGNAIMYPFSSASTSIVISSITYSATTHQDTVAWSRAQNGTPLTQGSIVTPPAGVVSATDGAGAILVSVTYHYTPIAGYFGSIPMKSSFYSRPRQSLSVACNGC